GGRAQEGAAVGLVDRGPLPLRGAVLRALRGVHPVPDPLLRRPELRAVQRGEHHLRGTRELPQAPLRRALSEVAFEHGAHPRGAGAAHDRAGHRHRLGDRLGSAREEAQGGLPARVLLAGCYRPRDLLRGLLPDLLGALRCGEPGARPGGSRRHR
ncbi:MAG: hypothetical protein AVDCRST_MAG03-1870, partial [uncultured Rubrobacteraceae bacterium]